MVLNLNAFETAPCSEFPNQEQRGTQLSLLGPIVPATSPCMYQAWPQLNPISPFQVPWYDPSCWPAVTRRLYSKTLALRPSYTCIIDRCLGQKYSHADIIISHSNADVAALTIRNLLIHGDLDDFAALLGASGGASCTQVGIGVVKSIHGFDLSILCGISSQRELSLALSRHNNLRNLSGHHRYLIFVSATTRLVRTTTYCQRPI